MRISDWSSDVCSSDLQDGFCRAYHPYAVGHCGRLPDQQEPASQPRRGDEDAEGAALRAGTAEARSRQAGCLRQQERYRLGPPDPLLCAASLPDGEGDRKSKTSELKSLMSI